MSQFNAGILWSIDGKLIKDLIIEKSNNLDASKSLQSIKALHTLKQVNRNEAKDLNSVIDGMRAMLHTIVSSSADLDLYDIAYTKTFYSQYYKETLTKPLLEKLNNVLSEKLLKTGNFNIYTEKQLLAILKAMPNSYDVLKHKIASILSILYSKPRNSKYSTVFETIRSLYKIGAPIPSSLMLEADIIPIEHYDRAIDNLVEVTTALSNNRMLTKRFLDNVLTIFEKTCQLNPQLASKYIEFIYDLSQSNSYAPGAEHTYVLNKILLSEVNTIPLAVLMKLAICYLPSMTSDILATKIVAEMQQKELQGKKLLDLAENLLTDLIESTKERPIYNYQIQSSREPIQNSIIQLTSELIKSIESSLASRNLVYEYYLSMVAQTPPPVEVLNEIPTKKSVHLYSKLLWAFQNHLVPDQLQTAVQNALKVVNSDSNIAETLFYLSSIYYNLSQLKEIKKVSLKKIENNLKTFINHSGDYTLATMFNLGHMPSTEFYEIVQNLRAQNLYGEALVKTIIMLSKGEQNERVAHACLNLGFTERIQPLLQPQLLKRFVGCLQKSSHHNLDYLSISLFFTNYINSDESLLHTLANFFENNMSDIAPELRGKLKEISMKETGEDLNPEPEEQMQDPVNLSTVVPSLSNLNVLDTISNRRISMVPLTKKYLVLLRGLLEKSDIFAVISKILETMCITGNSFEIINPIHDIIDRHSLWPHINQEILVNLLFLNLDKLSMLPNNVIERFLTSIYAGLASEAPFFNPASKLHCFQPFLFSTKLEPRYVTSNYRPSSSRIVVSTISAMTEAHVIYNCKVHAILNALEQKFTDETMQAVSFYYDNRSKSKDIRNFRTKFLKIFNENKKIPKEHWNDKVDPVTKWMPDVILEKYKTVIIYNTDEDMVYSESGEEVGLVYLTKVIKEQMERKSGLRCIMIRSKTWNSMDYEAQTEFVRNLGIEIR